MTASETPLIYQRLDYGVVCRPKANHAVSGDAYLLWETSATALIAVIDGLGSGNEAAQAAQCARSQVLALVEAPLQVILQACHQALRDTRGAVMGLLRLDFQAGQASFAGVGNIGIQVQSTAHEIKPVSRNGIVGHRLPHTREFRYPYTPGDLYALYSDGISSRFVLSGYRHILPDDDLQQIAEQIASTFGRDDDDVTLILVRERPPYILQGVPK